LLTKLIVAPTESTETVRYILEKQGFEIFEHTGQSFALG
jgi:hypothetical protein